MSVNNYIDRVLSIQPGKLIRYYPMHDRTGTTCKDFSPYAEDGTYSGPTLEGATGPFGRLIPTFDGINDYIDIEPNLDTDLDLDNNQEITIMAWATGASGSWPDASTDEIVDIQATAGGGGNNSLELRSPIDWEAGSRCVVDGSGATAEYAIPVGERSISHFHCCFTWDDVSGDNNYYFNGVFRDSTNRGTSWTGTPIITANIGARADGASRQWSGAICHVAIWATVLTAAEIRILGARP